MKNKKPPKKVRKDMHGKNNHFYGKHHSEETKNKIRETLQQNNPDKIKKVKVKVKIRRRKQPFSGRKHTEESKRKMSEAQSGKNHPMYGKKHSLETKMKLRTLGLGENNPRYIDGRSKNKYCFRFKELNPIIKRRDNYTCQLCGKVASDSSTRSQVVHHIHFDKENCDPDLITSCVSCNGKVNFAREYYEEYFTRQLVFRGLAKIYSFREIGIYE